jgi:hypothetical protein
MLKMELTKISVFDWSVDVSRCLTMTPNHRQRKNNAFKAPTFEDKLLLCDPLNTFHVGRRA